MHTPTHRTIYNAMWLLKDLEMKCNNRKGKEGKCLGHTDTDGDKYNQKQVEVLKNNTRYSRTQVL